MNSLLSNTPQALLDRFTQFLAQKIPDLYRSRSRIHPLRLQLNTSSRCFIKRDDELSGPISGSKIRKYLSLLPDIKRNKTSEVFVIGGASSNNVLGLSQLLIENGIKPTLLLRKPGNDRVQGNRLLIELLVPQKDIQWISRENWPRVEEIAASQLAERRSLGVRSRLIPEGAFLPEALEGALTLAADILRNESELQVSFDHVFVDAGTGLQAIALILGMCWLKHPARVHVVLLADQRDAFVEKLQRFHALFCERFAESMPFPSHFTLHPPTNAASFGSVNKKVFECIASFARTEGVFLDPIYSGKLIFEGKKIIQEQELSGNILLIHSGGTLSGFQEHCLFAL